MKYILFLLLLTGPFLSAAQTLTFERIDYHFFPTDSTQKMFTRVTFGGPHKIIIDTLNKKVTIPRIEVTESSCNRRDIVRNVYSSQKDTIIVVQKFNEAFTMLTRRVRHISPGIRAYDFTDGSTALEIYDHFIITYPVTNKYIRYISFTR